LPLGIKLGNTVVELFTVGFGKRELGDRVRDASKLDITEREIIAFVEFRLGTDGGELGVLVGTVVCCVKSSA
jgi:hypothetical protein